MARSAPSSGYGTRAHRSEDDSGLTSWTACQFLKAWLPGGFFAVDVAGHLAMCDTEVISAMRAASQDTSSPAHIPARRIMRSEHFRAVADFNAADRLADPGAAAHLASLLRSKFGEEALELDDYTRKTSGARFPVLTQDNKIEWSTLISATLNQVPTFSVQYVFVEPSIVAAAKPDVAQFRMLAPV